MFTNSAAERETGVGTTSQRITSAAGVLEEVTEQQLPEAARLAMVGRLAPSLAHEINNPLFAALGLLDFLVAEAAPGTKAHERLGIVRETVLEIKEIVQILARPRAHVAEERVTLRAVASDAVAFIRRASAARHVEFVLEPGAEPALVSGSARELEQVIASLVANAIDAIRDAGTVTVAVGRHGGEAWATVTDDGAGVLPQLRDRIFEPFFTTQPDAAGLGLAGSRAIASRHGGTLTLDPAATSGATFRLRLPAAPREAAS